MDNNNNLYISVVLCTYNDELYIKDSISSILNQTYPYFEFIIIDDGSTDNTNSIIKSFNDPRIVLVEKSNTGLIDSLNMGFKLSKYDWIARMDGDDISYPTRFEEQIKYLNDDVAVIGTQSTLIDEFGTIIGKTKLKTENKSITRSLKMNLNGFIHPSVIINKNKFFEVDGYDPFIIYAEDFDLWLKLSGKGKYLNINKELLYYRIQPNSISHLKLKEQFQNSQIALLKNKKKIYKNISNDKFNSLKSDLEQNLFYLITKAIITKKIRNIIFKRLNNLLILIFCYFINITTR